MYLPPHFSWTDPANHLAFCRAHPFATLVATGDQGLEAQHLPLLADHEEGRLVLRGHAALGNPIWKAAHALAIFTGPHAYVSAAWYDAPDTVPTWNYLAIHAAGPVHAITDLTEIRHYFTRLGAADPQRAAWEDRLSDAAFARLSAAVHWFRLDAERIEAKTKLSQNHPPERRQRVIDQLRASPDPAAQATGAAMARTLAGQQPWSSSGIPS